MRRGIVQFFIESKGFGYIRCLASREEFHVRRQHLHGSISRGDLVRFRVKEDKHGLYAADVQMVDQRT